jgi:hypothetical protein
MSSNINHSYPIQYLLSLVHMYWTTQICKCANWVLQAFLRPSPSVIHCYLKNKCCYTYSNSKLVTPSHTYVTCFTWANLKLSHALIKHKDITNHILPRPNYLPNHIDLPQLSSSIHIPQIMILYHILLIITSQYKLNRWTNPFQLFDLFDWVCIVCLCYAFSCAIVLRRVTCLVERREASCSSERQVTHISLTHFIMH